MAIIRLTPTILAIIFTAISIKDFKVVISHLHEGCHILDEIVLERLSGDSKVSGVIGDR